ncbi:MAG: DUF456 domain-containing protein [Flavobacteriales bacterium]|nr:DUF456 domain-containing protein [Flavobacteriales bacterium]
MSVLIIIVSVLLLILGIIGSFFPIVPGPSLSFIGILFLHFFTPYNMNNDVLILFGLTAVVITFLDYWLQIYSVRFFGGGRASTIGIVFGIIIGIFIPPFGVIIGPFLGAYIGAIIETDFDLMKSFKIAFGSLLGFMGGAILKLMYSIFAIWHYLSYIL